MFRRTAILALWLATTTAVAQAAAQIPLRDFARFSDYNNLKISPTGEYIAAQVRRGELNALAIIRLSDRKLLSAINFHEGQSVGAYWWVGPDRVVASVVYVSGSLAGEVYYGEMIGMNADGSHQAYVAGYRKESTTGTHIKGRDSLKGWARMIDPLDMDPARAIISVDSWHVRDHDNEGRSVVYALDTLRGKRTKITEAPFKGPSRYLTDRRGQVRYATGADIKGRPLAYYRGHDKEEWTRLDTGDLAGVEIVPLAFSGDDSRVYLRSDEIGDRECLVEHVLESNQRRALACDAEADLSRVLFSFDGGSHPIAAVFSAQKPVVVPIDRDDPDTRMLAALARSFPGQMVVPVSQTHNGSRVVLLVYSDRNPGDYYLFDPRAKKADYLFPRYSWIDPERQAEVRGVSFAARDGQTIHGYLTIPPGRAAEKLPLVMMPHGGPFDVRDNWGWDPVAQALASRGYAVLQVNYRGSDGYGNAFRNAGKRGWGTRMIDDITDGVKWTVTQGHADPDRLCIFGASYGGYAALTSAVREPELYKCAISYVGVYDLQTMQDESLAAQYKRGLNFFHETMGDKAEDLRAQSPISQLDRLKAALMIVHGKKDEIAPYSQAEQLREALDDRKYPYEWLVKADESHGFYRTENREELLRRVIAFLDQHIGSTGAGAGQ